MSLDLPNVLSGPKPDAAGKPPDRPVTTANDAESDDPARAQDAGPGRNRKAGREIFTLEEVELPPSRPGQDGREGAKTPSADQPATALPAPVPGLIPAAASVEPRLADAPGRSPQAAPPPGPDRA
ncbi:MAG: hypothetical protein D6754_05030, partial [Alphaproteobacteria bacterium]